MSSVYGFIDVDPYGLDRFEVEDALNRVDREIEEAEEWENGYASEVDRLKTLKSDLEMIRDKDRESR